MQRVNSGLRRRTGNGIRTRIRWATRAGSALAAITVAAGPLAVPDGAAAAVRPAATATAGATASGAPAAPATQTADPHTAAAATAKRTGKPAPVDALTTETSTTVANPDGTFTTSTSVQADRMRTATGWRDIDPTLRVQPDGSVATTATPNRLVLSGGGTGPVVAVDDGAGHSMALSLPGRLPAPTLSGPTATYTGLYPGIDLVVTAARSGGFSEVFTVHDPAAAQTAQNLRFSTALHGLKLTQDAGGNLFAADAKTGRTLWSAPPAELWDSATGVTGPQDSPESIDAVGPASSADRPGSGAHRGRLPMAVDASGLGLVGDLSRLGTSAPTYPLYLDPTWQLPSVSGGTLLNGEGRSGCPTATKDTSRSWLSVGYNDFDSCVGADRVFFQISTSNVLAANYIVKSATLKINEVYSAWNACGRGSETISIYTTGSNIGSVTWNTMPAYTTPAVTSKTLKSVGGTTPCAGGTVPGDFDVLGAITTARAKGWSNWTFVMIGDETPGSHSLEGFNEDPSIVTVYEVAPNTPTTTVAAPAPVRSDGTQWQGCDGNLTGYLSRANWGGQSTAQLSAGISSPLAQAQVHGHFEFYDHTVSGGKEWFMDSAAVGGSGGTATVTTPALTDGHQYTWQVNADDGYATSPVAHYCGFTVDISPPSNPIVQSSDFLPAGSSTPSPKKAGQAGLFSVSASDPAPGSGFRGYNYILDGSIGDTGTQFAAAGTGNLTITPTAWGPHTLYVQAVDNAGNVSATSQYSFYAPWNQLSPVRAGDLTGDGVPDIAATTTAGNLVAYNGGADPSLPPTVLSDAAHSPRGNGWDKYLVSHRGSFANAGVDDLWAYDTVSHGLFLNKNTGANPFTNPGNVVQLSKANVATDANNTSPTTPDGPNTACATTSTGSCAGYNNTDWSGLTQMVAVGDFYQGDTPGTCGLTAPSSCDNGSPGLLTVENGSLWYYQGQQSPYFLGTAVQLGTSGWNGVTLLAPGPVNGVPTLWARDNTTGALYQYKITFDAAGWPRNLGTPATGQAVSSTGVFTTPEIFSEGDVNGDGYPDLYGATEYGGLIAYPGKSTPTAPVSTIGYHLSPGSTTTIAMEPTIGRTPPTAKLSLSATTVAAGTPVTANASGTIVGSNPIASYQFTFGYQTTTPPASTSPTASYVYTSPGTYVIGVEVTDSSGQYSDAETVVTVTAAG
ncbi:VCBS repeat-containing protein [Catenulispora yoronensis]|uniref:VCBS repeat-containing protein n=1 Tax=Catenulispora yoronensis TaxID=450799 RepID=A0ABN2TNB7_9ACTN